MKYYIIAGEASGDLHGSNLIKSLQHLDNQALIYAWGGDMMSATGVTLRKHYRDLAFMGFIEVVKNLRTIRQNMAFCKADIMAFQPDVVIFIDYPGFNLRIAKWLKNYNTSQKDVNYKPIKSFYYISPQIWAWHTSRVHGIKATVDKMFCILPFEKDFYKTYNYNIDYVGHPLLDVIENYHAKTTSLMGGMYSFSREKPLFTEGVTLKTDNPIIVLMAGSRRQEIELMLPTMLNVASQLVDYQCVIAAAAAQSMNFYHTILEKTWANRPDKNTDGDFPNIFIVNNKTYDVLAIADGAIVKSGTSTLETALFGVPQVVCYKGSALSYAIAKRLITIKYISLVNLIADKEIVKELIQSDFTVENTLNALRHALDNRSNIQKEYTLLRHLLGNAGASARTAALMYDYLQGSPREK